MAGSIKETRVTTYFDANATAFKEEVRQIEKTLDGVGDTAKTTGGVFGKFGQDVATGIGLGFGLSTVSMVTNAIGLIKDGITKMVETGIEYEATMSKVQAITNATGSEMEQMSALALELGAKTSKSAMESAEAMTYMGYAGWDTKEILAGLPGVIDLSIASGEDLARVSDIVTDNLTAFGKSAEDAGYYADVLSYASSNANVTVDSLGEALKYVAPVATGAGVSMEETVAMVSLLGDAGIKGSQAGTTLRSVILNLTGANEKASKKLKELGVDIYDNNGKMRSMTDILGDLSEKLVDADGNVDTATASLLVGKTAVSGFTALLQTGDEKLGAFSKALENSTGTADRMASTMQDNVKGSLEELGGALETIGLKLYDLIDEPLKDSIDGFTSLIETIAGIKETEPVFTVFGEQVSESTYNALSGVEALSKGIKDQMGTLDLIGGTVTPNFVNQMLTNYGGLKDGIIGIVDQMHNEELDKMIEYGKTELGYTDEQINALHQKMDAYRDGKISKATELGKEYTNILKTYQDGNKVMSEEHKNRLLEIEQELTKEMLELKSSESDEKKAILEAYASDAFTITKDNATNILTTAVEHKDSIIANAQTAFEEQLKIAGNYKKIGEATDEEYKEMVKTAQEEYDKMVEEANKSYDDVAQAVYDKLGVTGAKNAKEAGEDVYKNYMEKHDQLVRDVADSEVVVLANTQVAFGSIKTLIDTVKGWFKNPFTFKVNVSKTTTHKNVYENVGKPSAEIMNRNIAPASNVVTPGMVRDMSSTINFNGQYSFGNRNDIDYFMRQTARMIDRKY